MHAARVDDDEPFLGSLAPTGGVGHGNGEGGRSAACAACYGRLAHGYQLVIQYTAVPILPATAWPLPLMVTGLVS